MPMSKFRKRLTEIVLQVIPVMIGVYLGFVVNNWSENARNQSATTKLVTNLLQEIQTNEAWINRVAEYHVMLRDSTNFYTDGEHYLDKYPAFFQGIILEPLQSSAYQTGIQTGLINELSIDLIQDLNQLYTLQQFYNDFSQVALAGMLERDPQEKRESLTAMSRYISLIMGDVIIRERYLLEKYEAIREKLE